MTMTRGLRALVLLFWFLLPLLVVADELSPLTSSLFEMKLFPTKVALQSSAANKLQLAIRTSLFQSVSVTSGFDNVFDIGIVLQKMQWAQDDESTTVQFQVHLTFLTEKAVGSQDSQPSQFALDSLVARTFSQPSTKSAFIVQLGLSKDPSLSAIENIIIQLVPSSNEQVTTTPAPDTRQFSTLDAVLITASSAIFVGILCVVYVQHRARERYDEDFLDMDRRKTRDGSSDGIDLEDDASPDAAESETTPKVDVTASMDSADDVPQELGLGGSREDHFPIGSKNEASQRCHERVIIEDGVSSPPLSPSPSVPSSSSEESPQTKSNSVPSSPVSSARTTAYLLGVATPSRYLGERFSGSPELSPLTARLLRLPAMMSGQDSKDKSSARSYLSAPGKLTTTNLSPTSSTSSRDGARSLRSVRSARLTSGLFDVIEGARLETSSTRSSNVTDLAVISEQNILGVASKDFENNWKISEKMAEEDEDDCSVLDVFHVDVDQHSSVEDNQSRMSGFSAVSDWMKSIRVVGGSSVGSRTSAMSKSSAEHSSIEPKSMQGRDAASIDYSLEQSLATSVVEV